MFKAKTNNRQIIEAVSQSNQIYNDLVSEIASLKGYPECSNVDWFGIAKMFDESSKDEIKVKTYWYWSRNVNGKFIPSHPRTIWINKRSRIINDVAALVSLIFHEKSHYVSNAYHGVEFHHDGNRYAAWKEATAPYKIDAIAEKLVGGDVLAPRNKASKIKYVYPWWSWRRWF